MTWDWTFRTTDVAIVAATLLGPILAVQAQKLLERRRDQDQRRRWVFRTLMATRATNLSSAHVEALNAVPIEFYGRSVRLSKVIEAWKVYLDHLNANVDANGPAWEDRRQDLFLALLGAMAHFLGYKFGPVELRREVYFPRGHAQLETDQETIRKGFASLLRGEKALPMEVRGWPVDEGALDAQRRLQARLLAWLDGDAAPRVKVEGQTEVLVSKPE